jgi:hypothetical protein
MFSNYGNESPANLTGEALAQVSRGQNRYRYRANNGGHAPGYLRDALLLCLDSYGAKGGGSWSDALGQGDTLTFFNADKQRRWEGMTIPDRARWLIGQLWNCTDTVPHNNCVSLDIPRVSTYAQLVRRLARFRR